MTAKQKRECFVKMCKVREELKVSEELVQQIVRERLTFMPYKKLYKFRECTENNFNTLEDNCIWMSLASEFADPFDNTINIDPRENAKEINCWIRKCYPLLCFDLAKGYLEQHGTVIPYTHEDFIEYMETCLDENGNPILEKERAFLIAHASLDELDKMELILQQLKTIRDRFAEIEDAAFDNIVELINQTRVGMREKALTYCMTERYDNHTLWENYADNYTGFCIEYSFLDFADKEFVDYKNLVYLFPMTYRKKRPYFNLVALFDGALRQFVYKDDSWQRDPELDADFNMQLYYKHSDYEYEHEWRFSIKPENENKQKFPFVNAIYAGKDIKKADLIRLIGIAKKLGVPVYKQKINNSHNGFEYTLIEEEK